ITHPVLPNANVVLMDNAKQLHFPKKLSRGNSRDYLYNDLIDLLKEKEIILEVFNLAAMMRKYAEHLQKSFQLTNNAHHSTELVRTPSKHCKLKIILSRLKVDSKYEELEKNLANRELYDFIKISEYLREFAILYKEFVCFILADDKHKIPIGEKVPTSTGVRNRPTMVPVNSQLSACDHDFTKLSITPSQEEIFKQLNIIEKIRKAAESNERLKIELINSIEDIQTLLFERTTRLVLNNNSFKCYNSVSNNDINELFEEMKHIDKSLQIDETTWAELRKHKKLMEFLKSHCQQRLYSFQNSLNDDEELQWQTALQDNLYTCGSPILDEEHPLYNTLFVRELISCNSPIETNYYLSIAPNDLLLSGILDIENIIIQHAQIIEELEKKNLWNTVNKQIQHVKLNKRLVEFILE
ncbi:14573_t:CDS:2, partial [Racocetra fulgida]